MDTVKSYFLSLCAAFLLVSLVQSLFSGVRSKEIVKLACGLILMLAVLSPLRKLRTRDITRAIENMELPHLQETQLYTQDAALMADIIREKSEAYIWDKAADLGFAPKKIAVEIDERSDAPCPCSVAVSGQYTQDQRMELTQWIENNLGVSEKSQSWKWEQN